MFWDEFGGSGGKGQMRYDGSNIRSGCTTMMRLIPKVKLVQIQVSNPALISMNFWQFSEFIRQNLHQKLRRRKNF